MPGTFAAIPGLKLQVIAQVSVSSGSATQVTATTPTIHPKQSVSIQAPSGNTASIWVGLSTVTNTNALAELQPGQQCSFPSWDPSTLYLYATSSGQKANVGWI